MCAATTLTASKPPPTVTALNLGAAKIFTAGWCVTKVDSSWQGSRVQSAMWLQVFSLVPALLINKLRYGRFLDIFISHAPPWHIHDKDDPPHQGVKAFIWLLKIFKPLYLIHGHMHVYRSDEVILTRVGDSQVLNTYGYKELVLDYDYLTVKNRRKKLIGG
jgi:hypothetical protein